MPTSSPESAAARRAHDERALARRLEVLTWPVIPLVRRRRLWSAPPLVGTDWTAPTTATIGPDGSCWTYRAAVDDPSTGLVSQLAGDGREPDHVVVSDPPGSDCRAQPMPHGRVLLALDGATPEDRRSGVWGSDGRREQTGDLGYAVAQVMTTAAGAVWVGYRDEGFLQPGPAARGLARYDGELTADWTPSDSGLPGVMHSYALNVDGEDAYQCGYTDFHLVRVRDGVGVDFGAAPVSFATGLLVARGQGAFVGGIRVDDSADEDAVVAPSATFDVLTPFVLSPGELRPTGTPMRLVLPDGRELPASAELQCRGSTLHLLTGTEWYSVERDNHLRPAQRGGTESARSA